jgi:hypothetical protein
MTERRSDDESLFRDAIAGLEAGDFSRLAPLFCDETGADSLDCRIVEWTERGLFADEPTAGAEALTCACFLGRTLVVEYLLEKGVDLSAGAGTGLDGVHWAANRGNLGTLRVLIGRNARLEKRNMYGGTVLGAAVWAAINEPRAEHLQIIETLIRAGARVDEVDYPTGNAGVDNVLRPNG